MEVKGHESEWSQPRGQQIPKPVAVPGMPLVVCLSVPSPPSQHRHNFNRKTSVLEIYISPVPVLWGRPISTVSTLICCGAAMTSEPWYTG